MKIAVDILPECYVDTNMVNTMLYIGGVVCKANHCKGCNKVAKDMDGDKLRDCFALGVIDNDKMQHSYTKDFSAIGSSEHLELLKHKGRHHFLIRVSPAMDGFVLDVARELGINMAEYGLPSELKEFTKLTKSDTVKDDKNLKRLFNSVKDQKEISLMRNILTYLYNNKYTYDVDYLKSLFL